MHLVPLPLVAFAIAALLPAQPQLLVPLDPPPMPAAVPMAAAVIRELSAAEAAAEAFRKIQVRGSDLTKAVHAVTKTLTWHDKLGDAARAARESGKPILWIQALGTLQGYT